MIHRVAHRMGEGMVAVERATGIRLRITIESSIAEVVAGLSSKAHRIASPGSGRLRLAIAAEEGGLSMRYGTARFCAWAARLSFDQEGTRTWGTVTVSPPIPFVGRAALTRCLDALADAVLAVDRDGDRSAS
jgi:hypothetical protein